MYNCSYKKCSLYPKYRRNVASCTCILVLYILLRQALGDQNLKFFNQQLSTWASMQDVLLAGANDEIGIRHYFCRLYTDKLLSRQCTSFFHIDEIFLSLLFLPSSDAVNRCADRYLYWFIIPSSSHFLSIFFLARFFRSQIFLDIRWLKNPLRCFFQDGLSGLSRFFVVIGERKSC